MAPKQNDNNKVKKPKQNGSGKRGFVLPDCPSIPSMPPVKPPKKEEQS